MKREAKQFKLYYLSPECGGMFERAYVYAHSLKEAIKMVANIHCIDERLVFSYD